MRRQHFPASNDRCSNESPLCSSKPKVIYRDERVLDAGAVRAREGFYATNEDVVGAALQYYDIPASLVI